MNVWTMDRYSQPDACRRRQRDRLPLAFDASGARLVAPYDNGGCACGTRRRPARCCSWMWVRGRHSGLRSRTTAAVSAARQRQHHRGVRRARVVRFRRQANRRPAVRPVSADGRRHRGAQRRSIAPASGSRGRDSTARARGDDPMELFGESRPWPGVPVIPTPTTGAPCGTQKRRHARCPPAHGSPRLWAGSLSVGRYRESVAAFRRALAQGRAGPARNNFLAMALNEVGTKPRRKRLPMSSVPTSNAADGFPEHVRSRLVRRDQSIQTGAG